MRHILTAILFLICFSPVKAQESAAFTHITTEDGTGLASNVVTSLYQDAKGFIWTGTANGLQRFDGRKFVSFSTTKPGGVDELPRSMISQIIPADSGRMIIFFPVLREAGLFDPSKFTYRKLPYVGAGEIPSRAEFRLGALSDGTVYCNITNLGVLFYEPVLKRFQKENRWDIPAGWRLSLLGIHEDVQKKQVWIATDSGLCIYDENLRKNFSQRNNPHHIPALSNPYLQDNVTEFYIDKQRRMWAFGWSRQGGSQYKYCFDSSGIEMLTKDTAGLQTGPVGYTEYRCIFEGKNSGMWVYGNGVLFSYNRNQQRFQYIPSAVQVSGIGIGYEVVYQLMEDRDGSLWLATDRGLFYAPVGNDNGSVVNIIYGNTKQATSITDILELPNGNIWFSSWGEGIRSMDTFYRKAENHVYDQPPPSTWSPSAINATRLPWALCNESRTGKVWIGCNEGVLMLHDPVKLTTQYLQPPEVNYRTIRYITEDKNGRMYLGTQSGRLVVYENGEFRLLKEIGTIIYKIFIDKQGLIWLATHEQGLYCVDPSNGNILQHYTTQSVGKAVFSNMASDIEQLNDSIIIYGGGALNFINKHTQQVRILKYEDGLPTNYVMRLRMDNSGYLWIVTSNGLCRYNPDNDRITPYGKRDGIMLGEQANVADLATSKGQLIFAGGNAVLMFKPDAFRNNSPPPDVTITDFQLFTNYLPVDSLLSLPVIKLPYDKNSISIYFASLSYTQRDKLTYYYKLDGVDQGWQKAERGLFANYSLLPPGKYTFSVYCENIEGMRSAHTTRIHFTIRPPFWRTWWFMSTIAFLIALIAYDLHRSRVNRLIAVEKLRNKVARDLHDDMGSTLSTINILSSMAKTKLTSDVSKTAEYLGKISDNSQRMMEAMDDIVWSIKPSNDNMNKVVARMREFATNVLEAKDIDLEFTVDNDIHEQKLNMEARRDFFLIFKEAVNNAAKYSKAGKVAIDITVKNKRIVLTVSDNGQGFDVKAADSGNGLGNMRKRAESMNGDVSINSGSGKGTVVILKIPVA